MENAMAWNEPGGNSNDQDPWGNRNNKGGGRQGPPDLDEALRKLQENLGGIFGGGNKKKPAGKGWRLWCRVAGIDSAGCVLAL
jgi:membrane protease subunit HflK